ncbi:hypothetical protein NKG05_04575 [Oerskovia sp. M15]
MLDGVPGLLGAFGRAQLRVWDQRWYWEVQARAMGIPAESRDLFVRSGLAIRRDNEERLVREIYGGCWPDGIAESGARVLAVAGPRRASCPQGAGDGRTAPPRCRRAPRARDAPSVERGGPGPVQRHGPRLGARRRRAPRLVPVPSGGRPERRG